MRRMFQLLGALMYLCFSSCNGENISDEHKEYLATYGMNIEVNTSQLFEEFGNVKDSVNSYLEYNPEKRLHVTTLLYDSDGSFVDSISSYKRDFGIVSQTFPELTEGNYTLIVLENIVDAENGYKSEYWRLEGVDNLSTARIVENNTVFPYHAIIGVAQHIISLDDNISTSLIPQSIGSIVYTTWEGFGQSNFDQIAFYQKSAVTHYRLEPSLTAGERYGVENNEERYVWEYVGYSNYLNDRNDAWFVLAQDGQEYIWGYLEDKDISENNMTAPYPVDSEGEPFSVQAGKTYHAHCRYNVKTGGDTFFGDSDGRDKWLQSLAPLPFYCMEPFWSPDADVVTVQEHMEKFEGQTKPIEQEGYYFITYHDICSAQRIEYWFLSESGGLYLTNIYFNKSEVDKNVLENYIQSLGYEPWRYTMNGCSYLSADEKTRLFLTETESEWLIQYY